MKKGIFLTAVCLLALSCVLGNDTTKPPPDGLRATTPVNCLKIVEDSFNMGNAIMLDGVLRENFAFHFDPDDVGQHPPGSNYVIPESWDYRVFRQAVNHMFYLAYSISLVIPTASVGTPDPNQTTYKAEDISIKLLVTVDEVNGYIADQGYCDFQFERYDGKEGEKLWHLTDWWDNTATQYDANPSLKPTSVGRILAMYE